MKIEVTQDDIALGIAEDFDRCPVALALMRVTGMDWSVDHYHCENDEGGRILLPSEAQAFIAAFDAGESVKPLTFEIEDRR